MTIATIVESVANLALTQTVEVFTSKAVGCLLPPLTKTGFFFGAVSVHMETPNV